MTRLSPQPCAKTHVLTRITELDHLSRSNRTFQRKQDDLRLSFSQQTCFLLSYHRLTFPSESMWIRYVQYIRTAKQNA